MRMNKRRIIYRAIYDQPPVPVELNFKEEVLRYGKLIKALQEKYPDMELEEAYITAKNAFSSINTYSIKVSDQEELT